MPSNGPQFIGGRNGPEPDGSVPAACGGYSTVRRKRGRLDLAFMPREDRQLPFTANVPKLYSATLVAMSKRWPSGKNLT